MTTRHRKEKALQLADDLDDFLVETMDDPIISTMIVHANQLSMAIRQYSEEK